MAGEPRRHETYTHGHAPATVRQHGRRTAEEAAAFLLPSLKAGMRLLDVGCGPGSITRGLAERLAPGEVVGVDLSRENAGPGARRRRRARPDKSDVRGGQRHPGRDAARGPTRRRRRCP